MPESPLAMPLALRRVLLVLGSALITFGLWWLAASGHEVGDMKIGAAALLVGLVSFGAALTPN